MMRYSRISNKNPREIVLLKSRPCKWGRCLFCDYIDDNCNDIDYINEFNNDVLKNVTGKLKQLEVINSASVFELPMGTLEIIRDIAHDKDIERLFFESHYKYRHRLKEITEYFKGINIIFKCGIETFDDKFRNEYLKKGIYFKDYGDIARFFKSICLMVGIKGQTKEMISRDIDIMKEYFEYGCINIFTENSTPVKRDEELISWFKENYSELDKLDNIEILWNNTDFGVGGTA
ncbi:MAG TPA: radical SAM protein [Thermoanaerobacterales bacterium]|nr:radical SAM protein [Thermoanaerobacterales bacterium]